LFKEFSAICRELRRLMLLPVTIVGWAASSVFLGITGPFTTYETLGIAERFFYWSAVVLSAIFLGHLMRLLVDTALPGRHRVVQDLMVIIPFSLLFSPVPIYLPGLINGHNPLMYSSYPTLVVQIFAITACVLVMRAVLHQLTGDAPEKSDSAPEIALLRRLPGVKAKDILRATVDDHYVEVHLADNSVERLLMRFADAVNELDGLPGYCVHRSHWVVADRVTGVLREQGKEYVVLSDQSRVPVSRTYRQNVIAAGWSFPRGRQAKAQARAAGRAERQKTAG